MQQPILGLDTAPRPLRLGTGAALPLLSRSSTAAPGLMPQRRGERKAESAFFADSQGSPEGRAGSAFSEDAPPSQDPPPQSEARPLRAHALAALAELVAGPSIAALYPPRVGLPCAILPRPRERQAAGWLLHCPLHSSQQLVVHGRRHGVSLILSSHKSILTDERTRHDSPHRRRPPPITIRVG